MRKFWPALPAAALLAALTTLFPPAAADEEPKPVKPVNLDCNTKADEDDPHVSSNNLTLYYDANTANKWDLMASTRKTVAAKWVAGKSIADAGGAYLPDAGDDRSVFVTPDNSYPQYLYFASNKNEQDQKGNNFDLYATSRLGPTKEFDPPVAMASLDTPADETAPWLTRDGKTLYFSRKTKEGWRLFTTTRKKATGALGFEDEPALIEELPPDFWHATLSPDGGTMYLQGPLDNGRTGLFVTTKSGKMWEKPEPLERLNDPSGPTGDRSPCLSRDGQTLYFASDRDGGKGGLDLYSVPVAELKKK